MRGTADARVDSFVGLITGAGVGNDILADREKCSQDGTRRVNWSGAWAARRHGGTFTTLPMARKSA
jgi:hypothetical protein